MTNKILIVMFFCLAFVFQNNTSALDTNSIEKVMDITDKKIRLTGGFASNLLIIGENQDEKYFKEQKFQEEKISVKKIVNFYFNDICHNVYDNEKDVILKKLTVPENLNKFLNMGWIHHQNDPLYLFLNSSEYRGDIIGIPEPISDELKELLPNFLKYASREIVSSNIEKGKSTQNYPGGTLRSLATFRLAKLLGLVDIIVKTEYIAIKQNGEKTKVGILMEPAKGITQSDFLSSNKKILPNFQRELANLHVFDAICMQNDHNPLNYMCKVDQNGDIAGVKAFDNDCSFPCNTNLTDFFFSLPPILTSDNKINLPHMDEELAKNIININTDTVANELKDLLAKYEIHALLVRIKKIQCAIRNTVAQNSKFLLRKDEWSDNTIKEELSEKYVRTYLKRFLKLK